MNVRDLLGLLGRFPPDLEIELAIVCPVEHTGDPVEVDRYPLDGVLAWPDEDDDREVVWFVGGEESDLDAFDEAMGGHNAMGPEHDAGA